MDHAGQEAVRCGVGLLRGAHEQALPGDGAPAGRRLRRRPHGGGRRAARGCRGAAARARRPARRRRSCADPARGRDRAARRLGAAADGQADRARSSSTARRAIRCSRSSRGRSRSSSAARTAPTWASAERLDGTVLGEKSIAHRRATPRDRVHAVAGALVGSQPPSRLKLILATARPSSHRRAPEAMAEARLRTQGAQRSGATTPAACSAVAGRRSSKASTPAGVGAERLEHVALATARGSCSGYGSATAVLRREGHGSGSARRTSRSAAVKHSPRRWPPR